MLIAVEIYLLLKLSAPIDEQSSLLNNQTSEQQSESNGAVGVANTTAAFVVGRVTTAAIARLLCARPAANFRQSRLGVALSC